MEVDLKSFLSIYGCPSPEEHWVTIKSQFRVLKEDFEDENLDFGYWIPGAMVMTVFSSSILWVFVVIASFDGWDVLDRDRLKVFREVSKIDDEYSSDTVETSHSEATTRCPLEHCRHGSLALRQPKEPVAKYVVEKDVKNNVVFVSRNYFSLDKRRRLFRVGSLKWLGDSLPIQMDLLRCKIRHGPGFYNCSLKVEFAEEGEKVAVVQLSEDDQGPTAGQFAAFYQGRTYMGSGLILESWNNQGFPVCVKAIEVAAMGDNQN
ncbi:hypothetical protein Vadar_010408 [Vaccinium darrowii]|uniref:Uncharacterized protein n=1 Tax=Vaccinium darrowii TaxID=229202 RepID=A0ACB7ZIP7_9ERIC|nr:hypothetical protein Vadar_010408 [Vaccinium darrowii]